MKRFRGKDTDIKALWMVEQAMLLCSERMRRPTLGWAWDKYVVHSAAEAAEKTCEFLRQKIKEFAHDIDQHRQQTETAVAAERQSLLMLLESSMFGHPLVAAALKSVAEVVRSRSKTEEPKAP